MSDITVLVVDDESRMRKLIKDFLAQKGYSILEAEDGEKALSVYQENKEKINLILLDVMMPKLDGWSVLRQIRQENKNLPIVMLTARSEEQDELFGFELGVDEYITKPFAMKELVLRVRNVLKRVYRNNPFLIEVDGYLIDEGKRRVSFDGQYIELTTKEYDLLLFFIKNKSMALSR